MNRGFGVGRTDKKKRKKKNPPRRFVESSSGRWLMKILFFSGRTEFLEEAQEAKGLDFTPSTCLGRV